MRCVVDWLDFAVLGWLGVYLVLCVRVKWEVILVIKTRFCMKRVFGLCARQGAPTWRCKSFTRWSDEQNSQKGEQKA